MIIKQIPKMLLPHEIKYKEYVKNERWGNTHKDAITIKNVVVSPNERKTFRNTSISKECSHVIIVDNINSTNIPNNGFVKESIIIWEDNEYMLTEVKINYAFDKIHHYELGLS